jgi:lipooligosaccharide transport system permease protein
LRIKGAFRVWQRNFTVYTKRYKTSLVLNFVEPMLYLTAMGLGLGAFVSDIKGVPYIKFIAPGMVASSAMFAAVFECTYGTYVRMTFQRTFDAILATPVGVDEITAGEIFWGAFKCVLYGTIIMIVITAFGLVDSPLAFAALPAVFLGGVIFAEICVIFTSLSPGIDLFNYFYTLFITPLFLFSGIFFPLDGMPRALQTVSACTPLYHLVLVCRGCAAGDPSVLPLSLAYLVILAAVLAPLPFRLMRKRMVL